MYCQCDRCFDAAALSFSCSVITLWIPRALQAPANMTVRTISIQASMNKGIKDSRILNMTLNKACSALPITVLNIISDLTLCLQLRRQP